LTFARKAFSLPQDDFSRVSSPSLQTIPRGAPNAALIRIVCVAALFGVELLLISVCFDGESLSGRAGLAALIARSGAWTLRLIAAFAALFGTFAILTKRRELEAVVSGGTTEAPIDIRYLTAHLAAIAAFFAISRYFYGPTSSVSSDVVAVMWLMAGVTAVIFGALAFLPLPLWTALFRVTGNLWAYVAATVLVACFLGFQLQSLWGPASRLTFSLARWLLTPFVSVVVSNPAAMLLGTSKFRVIISPQCSGLEGAGLMLGFSVLWLILFSRECRFPHALILIPIGVVAMFLLNACRIAALVLVGTYFGKPIAAGGFHSQAGWILFNVAAVAFIGAVRHVPWFSTQPRAMGAETLTVRAENPTAHYLGPFLAIMVAGMLAAAVTSAFVWWYPLRLVGGVGALWVFRRAYTSLNWRFDAVSCAAGAIVFIIWIALDHSPRAPMPAALGTASPGLRWAWIVARVLSAIVVVPLAEELAFRGFLMRRFISAEFECISLRRVTWWAVALSSVLFGALHGSRWIAGSIAGVVFAAATIRKGRIGDGFAAHLTANALLAIYVLASGNWQFW
jgi:exosortase E/protease (VPEID-CTERM system)